MAIGDLVLTGYPHYHPIHPSAGGSSNCLSRCVRRACLCGEDVATGPGVLGLHPIASRKA